MILNWLTDYLNLLGCYDKTLDLYFFNISFNGIGNNVYSWSYQTIITNLSFIWFVMLIIGIVRLLYKICRKGGKNS